MLKNNMFWERIFLFLYLFKIMEIFIVAYYVEIYFYNFIMFWLCI